MVATIVLVPNRKARTAYTNDILEVVNTPYSAHM